MVITQLRFSDFKAGRCKDTVVTDLLRFWESRNVKNLAKFCDYYQILQYMQGLQWILKKRHAICQAELRNHNIMSSCSVLFHYHLQHQHYLARLPNASKNMCFLNITISLYDYSLSRSTSDGYDAFSREDSDQKSQKIDVVLTVLKEAFKRSISGGKKGEDSCALSMRNNVQRVLEPTTSSYYRKAHNSEPTCRRIQATYRPDPRTTVS
ncbi:hypothetical protein F2Q70_00020984 [Brassica cretica]|uniref:Uncharacterized protein n=2 Tax=Brassica cretica TaxID=69181 RepID=A0A8S9GTL7_BRACR|nr:hypothetical protein F2Q70_00020984 [Brassica cretica]KAF2557852.1 hypothetical protein F2Q68_00014458 [Brassica cretica]KAF3605864.1 hypothetical protein DY000_02046953 [Brassica cretica]